MVDGRVRKVEKYKHANYLSRAEQCLRTSQKCLENRDFDASVINAVHSAIAAADALLVNKQQIRSAGQDHRASIYFFEKIDKECSDQAFRLKQLLGLKTESEYGEYNMAEKDAREAVLNAERLLKFVKSKLSP